MTEESKTFHIKVLQIFYDHYENVKALYEMECPTCGKIFTTEGYLEVVPVLAMCDDCAEKPIIITHRYEKHNEQ